MQEASKSGSSIKEIFRSADSDRMKRSAAYGASQSVPGKLEVLNIPTKSSSGTVGQQVSNTIRPHLPQPDASTAHRAEVLEGTLDSLQGQEILEGFRVLPGHSNRFRGGVKPTALCRTLCQGQCLRVLVMHCQLARKTGKAFQRGATCPHAQVG